MNHRTTTSRLTKLADYLEHKVAVADFNMCYWYKEHDCGYAGCAVGHACQIPTFRRAGLHLSPIPFQKGQFTPTYQGSRGMQAVKHFFGITDGQVLDLFFPESYSLDKTIRPGKVVKRIRALIRKLEQDYQREVGKRKKVLGVKH